MAKLYKCANGTKTINQGVKRHINRFPEDFYFQLSYEEYISILKSQTGTSRLESHGGIRKMPFVFTEEGVAMLTTVLRTPVAEEVSINFMRTFVKLRKYISTNLLEQKYINNMVLEHDNEIKILKQTFSAFKEKSNEIYLYGINFDAYSKIADIFKEAKERLIIIDNYADKTILEDSRI